MRMPNIFPQLLNRECRIFFAIDKSMVRIPKQSHMWMVRLLQYCF